MARGDSTIRVNVIVSLLDTRELERLRAVEAEIRGLRVTPDDIEGALLRLRGPVTRDESIAMAAAMTAAHALRAALAPEGSGEEET